MKKKICIICPIYNEEDTINIFYARILKVIDRYKDFQFEIFFSDNDSSDGSYEKVRAISNKDKRVKLIKLSRNFGYQNSLMAALNYINASSYIIIDVDCEDPPEMVDTFIKFWKEGFDIVYGIRKYRSEPKYLIILRKLYYRFMKFIADYNFILDMAEFSLIDKKVRDEIIKVNDTFPFIRNEIAYLGFKKKGIEYKREKRVAGKTHYNYFNMVKFGLTGALTSSTFFLRINIYFFLLIILVNIFFLIQSYSDFLSIKLILIINLTYISYAACFISLYISRIYKNIVSRARYVIDLSKSINL